MNKRKRVFSMTGGRCFYCGCKLDIDTFHCDHYIAKANGGKNKNNLVPACADCNLAKSSMSLEEFRYYIETLLDTSIKGRMIKKYYGLKRRKVLFFFEKKGWSAE